MNPRITDTVITLTSEALADVEGRRAPLSAILQKTVRVARLRSDWDAVWWLSMELIPAGEKHSRARVAAEVAPNYALAAFNQQNRLFVEAFIEERTIERDLMAEPGTPRSHGRCLADSVQELEARIEAARRVLALPPPGGMAPLDMAVFTDARNRIHAQEADGIRLVQSMLDRIAQRAHEYLSRTEKQLLYGQLQSDIFERNRCYVDGRLATLVPEAASQFISAYSRASDGTAESRALALTSCRRVIKTVADKLYPARSAPVSCGDGKVRSLDDAHYVARLHQFVHDTIGRSTAAGVIEATITGISSRLDALYPLSSKGVHGNVSEFEANMCVIQTYLLIGDLLRLEDGSSAVAEGQDPQLGRPDAP